MFVGLASLTTFLSITLLDSYKDRQNFYVQEILTTEASIIERSLEKSFSTTRVLAQEVSQRGGDFDDFDSYADNVIKAIGGVTNLQLAPQGIVQRIYPLAGNEKALGHDILRDDKRKEQAHNAILTNQLTVAGPFELIQGGVGLIGRNPIFLFNATTGTKEFWGFASALILVEDMISKTDLKELEQKGYRYELSSINPETGALTPFLHSEMPLGVDSLSTPVRVLNEVWTLTMTPAKTVSSFWYVLAIIICLMMSFGVTFLLRKVLMQPEILREVVDQQTKELQRLAHHDPLTSLPNRLKLWEAVHRVYESFKRYQESAALLIIDLDDFKKINDFSGHDYGDRVLKTLASRLQACVRESDMVARIGGDEFGVLLHRAEVTGDVESIVLKILQKIQLPIVVGHESFTVSASIGIAFVPADGDDYMSAYKHADMAMYRAKTAGKNQFCFFDDSMQKEAVANIETQKYLHDAVRNGELELYLQPMVDFKTSAAVGYEALLRWHHPEKGLVSPDEFIQIAETSNDIFKIGYWVFREACRLIVEESIDGIVSINLSPKQFNDPKLVSEIQKSLSFYQVDPSRLEVEVTESCMIDSFHSASSILQRFIDLGLKISLDDFGTGFSSLALLRCLPVQKIKIDRSFVSGLENSVRDKNIVEGLVSMSHKLNLEVVAEGIENKPQYDLLKKMGCDFAQGNYLSEPIAAEQITSNVRAVN